jgi:K+-transporting ATPase KdpF subunit
LPPGCTSRAWSGFEEATFMSLEYVVGILLSVLLLIYLVYALLKPERF